MDPDNEESFCIVCHHNNVYIFLHSKFINNIDFGQMTKVQHWLINQKNTFFFTPVNHNFVCLSKQANWKRDLKIHKALANFSTHFVGNEQDDNRKQERSISWGENERNFSENGQEPGWEPIDVWIHQRSTNWCLYHASPHICLQYRLNQCSIEISTINISVVKNIQLSFISQIKCCMFI